MIDHTPKLRTGPRWIKFAMSGETQVDESGERWQIRRIEAGGRVIHWESMRDGRAARSEISSAHPEYPSDAEVVAWEREQKRIAREQARFWYP